MTITTLILILILALLCPLCCDCICFHAHTNISTYMIVVGYGFSFIWNGNKILGSIFACGSYLITKVQESRVNRYGAQTGSDTTSIYLVVCIVDRATGLRA